MKKYLLPAQGRDFKANLHCHTTFSDGECTPEEIKKIYRERGYSVVAFTDHDILIPHDELNDEDFLALHGFETETTGRAPSFWEAKTCHLCYIAIKKDQLVQPNWHRTSYLIGNAPLYADKVRFDETKPDFVREYTPGNINEMIANARNAGFFVTYNHPTWSLESYPEYCSYEGMHAMEIVNHGACAGGFPDYNPRVSDDMLRAGKRIFCIAADDNHNVLPPDDPKSDACGGFTVIRAEALEYEKITSALLKGHFYASTGPLIKELFIEDGVVHLKCSPAARIDYTTAIRRCGSVVAKKGRTVGEAFFRISRSDGYFRITVTGKKGDHACTNAYFTDEVL